MARAPRLGATMLAYLDQLAVSQRPGHDPIDRHRAAVVRRLRDRPRPEAAVRPPGAPTPHRGLQDHPGRHPGTTRRPAVEEHDGADASGDAADVLRTDHRVGLGRQPRPAAPCSRPTSPASTIRSPSSWTTPRRPGSCAPPPQLDPLRRLIVEMLARTGMRVGELCALAADAVMIIGDAHWLRIPVGKLHHDRLIPLHPALVEPARHLAGVGRAR